MDLSKFAKQFSNTGLAALLGAALVFGGSPAMAREADESPAAGAMVADAVVARPLGVAITTVGVAAFVVSLPFSALGGNVKEAADKLIVQPGKNTFVRCLGCRSVNE